MLIGNLRVILCHFLDNLSPQSGGIQHVGLVHAGHFLPALHGNIKTADGDPADLIFIIGQRINGFLHAILLDGLALSEVQATGQLPHDHHIKTVADDLVLQRACAAQLTVQICRAQVGKQVQRLSDLQKACFRS